MGPVEHGDQQSAGGGERQPDGEYCAHVPAWRARITRGWRCMGLPNGGPIPRPDRHDGPAWTNDGPDDSKLYCPTTHNELRFELHRQRHGFHYSPLCVLRVWSDGGCVIFSVIFCVVSLLYKTWIGGWLTLAEGVQRYSVESGLQTLERNHWYVY